MTYLLAILLSFQVNNNLLAETEQPTLAPPCRCAEAGDSECTCEVCDCHAKAEPIVVSVRKPRIDAYSPVTLAPIPLDLEAELEAEIERENSIPRERGPSDKPFQSNFRRDDIDEEPGMIAFKERHKEPGPKVWTGAALPPESADIKPTAGARIGLTHPQPAAGRKAASSPQRTQPPTKTVPPIEQAAMVRVFVCDQYGCRYEYRPASQAPTKSVQTQSQTYQRRRGLLRRWR